MLTARLQMGPSYAPMLAHPVVLRRSARELVWRGKIVHEVLLSTEHRFACLDAQCAEETEWIHCERFGGLLGWLFVLAFGRTVRETFCRMNERLRELAEDEYARVRLLSRSPSAERCSTRQRHRNLFGNQHRKACVTKPGPICPPRFSLVAPPPHRTLALPLHAFKVVSVEIRPGGSCAPSFSPQKFWSYPIFVVSSRRSSMNAIFSLITVRPITA